MKPFITFIAFFFVFSAFGQGNWHPFPFKVSYFARPDSFGRFDGYQTSYHTIPPNSHVDNGYVVEALYLDEFSFSSGMFIQSRSDQYPTSYNEFPPEYTCIPLIRNSNVITSADSHLVQLTIRTSVDVMSINFYPKLHNAGQAAIEGGTVLSKVFTTTFNLPDSVAVIRMLAGDTLKWSKRFGMLNLPIADCKLVGIKDLGLGWQDVNAVANQPGVGDEYHYVVRKKGQNCNPMPGSPPPSFYEEYFTVRMKVLEYPYQNSGQALYQVIYSDSGATNGTEYEEIRTIPTSPLESSNPTSVGTFDFNYLANSAWKGRNGVTFNTHTKQVCSECGIGTLINSCTWLPYQVGYLESYINMLCEGYRFALEYPVYIKINGNCESGTPLPPVVITSSQSLKSISGNLFPNPTSDFLEIEIPGQIQSVELSDVTGCTVLFSTTLQENRLDVSGLNPGLYWLRIQTNEETTVQKLIKN